MRSVNMTGWRYTAFIAAFIGAVGAFLYPIAIDPYLNPEPWRKFYHGCIPNTDHSTFNPSTFLAKAALSSCASVYL